MAGIIDIKDFWIPRGKKILLVQPDFPIPNKRKVHHDFFPIGLLKIGSFLKNERDCEVELTFENKEASFTPDEVWITSLFTYWSSYVHDSINYFKNMYSHAKIFLGGIYATLIADNASMVEKHLSGVTIQKGLYDPAEIYCRENGIDETILSEPLNFQILHSTRGCFRRCNFCGTWKIEPNEFDIIGVENRINKNHVVFYDNNILKRNDVSLFIDQLSELRVNTKRIRFESQSGFDGRILDQNIANKLKKANFINIRIAWDGKESDYPDIEKQINFLSNAGYSRKDISVFMLFNWNIGPEEMERKRMKCWEMRVQISDCRFRPLDQLQDDYSTRLKQDNSSYHIHENWSDDTIKRFRRNIRKHNICVRHDRFFYSTQLERMKFTKEEISEYNKMSDREKIREKVPDAWFPDEDHMLDLTLSDS